MSAEKCFVDISQYKLIVEIGKGNYGIVYRVKDLSTGDFYAAKVSKLLIDESTQDLDETKLLFREVNLMILLNHPSIIKFIGYSKTNFENDPCPTIISEFATNGSLRDIINLESAGLSPDDWNFTKKLINIYGIASGMSYLHANKVIHRDLKPENILIDDYLYPKISDFGLSKITDILSISMNFQSQAGMKGTPIYMAPEIFKDEKYSTSSDVYAFGMIIYEILTNDPPFDKKTSFYDIIRKVSIEKRRPIIKEDVPDVYRDLINQCWAQEPDERPSFDEIVYMLKNKEEFITNEVDKLDFFDYVEFIDTYHSSFNDTNKMIHFADFIKVHGRNKNIRKVTIKKIPSGIFDEIEEQKAANLANESDYEESDKSANSNNVGDDKNECYQNPQKIRESDTKIKKIKENDANPQKIREDDVNPQKIGENDTNLKKIKENDANPQKIKEDGTNPLKIKEDNENSHKIRENDTNSQKIREDDTNSQKIKEDDTNSQKIREDDTNSQKIREDDTNSQKIREDDTNSQRIKEDDTNPQKIREDYTNSQKIREDYTNSQKIREDDTNSQKIKEDNANSKKTKEDDTNPQKIKLNESSEEEQQKYNILLYPYSEFKKLNKICQTLVEDAETDSNKLFYIGKSLIEGENEFPKNANLGIQYLKQANSSNCLDSLIYYTLQLIRGKFIPQNLDEAKQILSQINQIQDNRILILQGKLSKKMNKNSQAMKYFEEGAKKNDNECIYNYAKMLLIKGRSKKNDKEIIKYLTISKEQKYKKCEYFLMGFNIMNNVKDFAYLNSETQFLFISNIIKIFIIKDNQQIQPKEIAIKPQDTEKLFFNKSLKNPKFLNCLSTFQNVWNLQNINFEIEYPSKSFKPVSDLILKIKNKNDLHIQIGIVFISFKSPLTKDSECFADCFSY